MKAKLHKVSRARRGETLVEILVAILIIALASGLFASMYMAAMNLNLAARKDDDNFYKAVTDLEQMVDDGTGTAVEGEHKIKFEIKPETSSDPGEGESVQGGSGDIQVDVYTQDGMSVYKQKGD